eukprot:4160059-Ditylum_brightwellii.AAC.1
MTEFDKSVERKVNEDNPWYATELGVEPDRIILDDNMEDIWRKSGNYMKKRQLSPRLRITCQRN